MTTANCSAPCPTCHYTRIEAASKVSSDKKAASVVATLLERAEGCAAFTRAARAHAAMKVVTRFRNVFFMPRTRFIMSSHDTGALALNMFRCIRPRSVGALEKKRHSPSFEDAARKYLLVQEGV